MYSEDRKDDWICRLETEKLTVSVCSINIYSVNKASSLGVAVLDVCSRWQIQQGFMLTSVLYCEPA